MYLGAKISNKKGETKTKQKKKGGQERSKEIVLH